MKQSSSGRKTCDSAANDGDTTESLCGQALNHRPHEVKSPNLLVIDGQAGFKCTKQIKVLRDSEPFEQCFGRVCLCPRNSEFKFRALGPCASWNLPALVWLGLS